MGDYPKNDLGLTPKGGTPAVAGLVSSWAVRAVVMLRPFWRLARKIARSRRGPCRPGLADRPRHRRAGALPAHRFEEFLGLAVLRKDADTLESPGQQHLVGITNQV